MQAKRWDVAVLISQEGDDTYAESRLQTPDRTQLAGCGHAARQPDHPLVPLVPEVNDELAVARSLSDLAQQLFRAAIDDIKKSTHERVSLNRY